MKRGNAKEAAAIFARGLNTIIDDLNEAGCLPMTKDGQWRITIVARNVDDDRATVMFGMDDEAALIIALQQLGSAKGRAASIIGRDGERKGDGD